MRRLAPPEGAEAWQREVTTRFALREHGRRVSIEAFIVVEDD